MFVVWQICVKTKEENSSIFKDLKESVKEIVDEDLKIHVYGGDACNLRFEDSC